MTSTGDKALNETEDTTLRVPEMAAREAQDADLALPGFRIAGDTRSSSGSNINLNIIVTAASPTSFSNA
jgi:hypothetical protein